MRVLHDIDRALWRLPRCARRALVAPLVSLMATRDALSAGCKEWPRTWRGAMDHVNERPEGL